MFASLRERVLARLEALGLGPIEAATKGKLERTYIRDITEGRKQTVTMKMMPRLAAALHTTPAYLQGDTDDPEIPSPLSTSESDLTQVRQRLVTVPKVGRTEAGEFREVLEFDDDEREFIVERPDDEFPNARMTAFEVAGDSMNAAEPPIMPGSVIVCVNFDDTGLPLIDGMIVVIERTRNGGLTREWSVKEVETFADKVVYHPRSTNKKHKPIVVQYNAEADDGQEVRVLALVRRISIAVPKFKAVMR